MKACGGRQMRARRSRSAFPNFADPDRMTVSHVLTRQLDGIASAGSGELSWTTPGARRAC